MWAKPTPPTIYIIGDSTAAQKVKKVYPETGWGMCLGEYLAPEVVLINKAVNGRSTVSFRMEKRWDSIQKELKKDDVVLIQFGHNDQKLDKPGTGCTPEEYAINLGLYVKEARALGAYPILISSIARRNFKEGVFQDTHGEYPVQMKSVAKQSNVPFIDMHGWSSKVLQGLGEQASQAYFNHVPAGHENYPNGLADNTHFSPLGAKEMAKEIARQLKQLNSPIQAFMK